jgi:bidirectional [NiFe] hydrogenase diaphorase subunit
MEETSMSETTPKKKDAEKPHPMGDPRYKGIDRVLKRQQYQQDALIEVLTAAQEAFGYLTEESMAYTARQLRLPFSWVYGVATFYHFFSLKPQGEHSCIVCLGTACYVGKAADIIASVEEAYNVKAGQTTADQKLTLIATRCLGCCGLAPVVVLDQVVHGKETPEGALVKVREVIAGGNGG